MKLDKQFQAKILRRKGLSLNEISHKLGVSKGSVSLWVRNEHLSASAQKRLQNKKTKGQKAAAKANIQKRVNKEKEAELLATKTLSNLKMDYPTSMTLCALIFWCEGGKRPGSGVEFTNSDPDLVRFFVTLMRELFDLDETKFRICAHLHNYHDQEKQLMFWSKHTKIPLSQFSKTYNKPNTSKAYRENYPGCVRVRYYDSSIARALSAVAKQVLNAK